ncbi:MAG: septum formation initiator family protein [Oscillospiraceae bacterium]|nr:septum formation initiator family protein [Oscillospiraceae bacterium]
MQREKKISGKKIRKGIFIRIALIAFSLYMVTILVNLGQERVQRYKTLDEVEQAVEKQKQINQDLRDKNRNYDRYLEELARARGLSRPGEIIFIEYNGANP